MRARGAPLPRRRPAEEPTTRIECRFRLRRRASWLNVESTVNRHHGGLIFNSRDVTERVRLQAQLQHNAEHDPLTDLPNRALFTRARPAGAVRPRAGRPTAGTAVLFIDLDGFKARQRHHRPPGRGRTARPGRPPAPGRRSAPGDTAARLGGDEFAALIVGDGSRDTRTPASCASCEIADRLRATLSQPYRDRAATRSGSPPPSASPSPSPASAPAS